jgi:hypothetical protein
MAFTVVAVIAGTGVLLGAGLNGPAEPEDGAASVPDGADAPPTTAADPTPEPVGRPDSSHAESGTSEDRV